MTQQHRRRPKGPRGPRKPLLSSTRAAREWQITTINGRSRLQSKSFILSSLSRISVEIK
ncbi:hypothetical protein HanIR_Chr11g0535831 [Helianthus annuus]|nr:hypothetical protein HanIR_Chr11g0535831 [Helianthus annuus]